jgi:hypothetical protein
MAKSDPMKVAVDDREAASVSPDRSPLWRIVLDGFSAANWSSSSAEEEMNVTQER